MTSESATALATEAHQALENARRLISTHTLDALPEAAQQAGRAMELFEQLHDQGDAAVRRDIAAASLARAKALRDTGTVAGRHAALALYPAALEHLEATVDPGQPDQVNELASVWMQQGITLMDVGSSEALTASVTCFDRAISLRQVLPVEQQPLLRWGLAAAWMNRADGLTRLGGALPLQSARDAYDEAIRQLGHMPPGLHPSYLSRLSLAWMNRGLTCQAQDSPAGHSEAINSYSEAVALLRDASTRTNPEQRRLLACTLVNRGGALLACEPAQPLSSRKDALAAIHLAAEFERLELLAAQVGLQARHLLCRAVASLADAGFPGLPESEDWVTQTTDAVDEGMALTRHWRLLGESSLDALALDVFRFGSLVYAVCQPHFLAAFLLESLTPGKAATSGEFTALREIAIEALWRARSRGPQEAVLEELKQAEQQILALGGEG